MKTNPRVSRPLIALLLGVLSSVASSSAADEVSAIDAATMQLIYEDLKTPIEYGIVLEPPEGKKVDCPNVFRHGRRWFMVCVQLENEPVGYSTQLAASDDLLHWRPLGTILPRGAGDSWDVHQAAGGVALFDTAWGGSNTLGRHDGRYWIS